MVCGVFTGSDLTFGLCFSVKQSGFLIRNSYVLYVPRFWDIKTSYRKLWAVNLFTGLDLTFDLCFSVKIGRLPINVLYYLSLGFGI